MGHLARLRIYLLEALGLKVESLVIALLGIAALAGLSLSATWLARRRLLPLTTALESTKVHTFWLASTSVMEGRFKGRPASVSAWGRSDPGLEITLESESKTFPFELLRATRTARLMNWIVGGKDSVRHVGKVLIGTLGDPDACSRWLALPGSLEAVERLMGDGRVHRLRSSGRFLIAYTDRISRREVDGMVTGILEALLSLNFGG